MGIKKERLKVLVTGADGMVGSYVDFGIKTNRSSLDVTDPKKTLAVIKGHKPDVILHLAALTDVDQCERDPNRAYLINSVGAYHVALAARECGAKIVYISTAGVFDGKKKGPYAEDDIPNPQNYYGYSKFLGELAICGVLTDHLIIRTCWMMGGGPQKDKKFVAKIIGQLMRPGTKEIDAVSDQVGSPTFAKDLVAAIKRLIDEDARGIYHIANAGVASRFDVAKKIVSLVRPDIRVNAVPTSFFHLDAKRTMNEALSSKVDLMRPWGQAVEDYIKSEWMDVVRSARSERES
jgi:dTDP-4-dehydrorhamnose reductase